jgi:tryptophan-rich sensory protein
MVSLLDRPDRSGLIANIAVALAIVLSLNALIFGLGWEATSAHAPRFVPPPVVIGLVWVALFVCIALARWELNRATAARIDKAGVIVLFALCAAYPLYTAGLKSDLAGEAGNVALLILTGRIAVGCARRAPRAAAWLAPLFVWLSFAAVAGAFTLAPNSGKERVKDGCDGVLRQRKHDARIVAARTLSHDAARILLDGIENETRHAASRDAVESLRRRRRRARGSAPDDLRNLAAHHA